MKEVTDAPSRYMDDNYMTLRALVPGVGSRTTVSFSDLQSGGSLQGLVHTSYTSSSFANEPKHALKISRMVSVSGGYTDDINPLDVISATETTN